MEEIKLSEGDVKQAMFAYLKGCDELEQKSQLRIDFAEEEKQIIVKIKEENI